jgi:tripartite-type tricarboxylate transporter receptor subunit TctC
MPADLVAKIQDGVIKIVSDPDVKNRFAKLGFEPIGSTSAYFTKYIKDEMSRYEQIIKDANIQSQ